MPSRPGAHDLISGEKPNSWLFDENVKKSNHAPRRAHDLISGEKPNSCPPQPWVGDGDDGGDDDDGRIFPEHPSPILHAPRDIISRKGKSLTPICHLMETKYVSRISIVTA